MSESSKNSLVGKVGTMPPTHLNYKIWIERDN